MLGGKPGDYNFVELYRFLRSKKISPWFWVFTVGYFVAIAYVYTAAYDVSASGDNLWSLLAVLFAPYSLVGIPYLSFASNKRPLKRKGKRK